MLNTEGKLKEYIKEIDNKRDIWNIIKIKCRTRKVQSKNQTLLDMSHTSAIVLV